MQINSINNNNPNFKAKIEVNLDNKLIKSLKKSDPLKSVLYSDGILQMVETLKEFAPRIGKDSDFITLSNRKFAGEQWIDVKRNGELLSSYSPYDNFADETKVLLYELTDGLINFLREENRPKLSCLFQPITGYSDLFIKKGFQLVEKSVPTKSNVFALKFVRPEVVKPKDLIAKVEKLNTQNK